MTQAQYLVMLEDDTCCSSHCSIVKDVSSATSIVAGAVFGSIKSETGKWEADVANDHLLKLAAPPRAALLLYISRQDREDRSISLMCGLQHLWEMEQSSLTKA